MCGAAPEPGANAFGFSIKRARLAQRRRDAKTRTQPSSRLPRRRKLALAFGPAVGPNNLNHRTTGAQPLGAKEIRRRHDARTRQRRGAVWGEFGDHGPGYKLAEVRKPTSETQCVDGESAHIHGKEKREAREDIELVACGWRGPRRPSNACSRPRGNEHWHREGE